MTTTNEQIIEALRPYLHFGTNGWRRVAESAVEAIRPFLKEGDAFASVGKPMAGWQDIETAPMDTEVLLYWNDWTDTDCYEAGYAGGGRPRAWRHGAATHWMHLPTPPERSRP
jgi:hypothetical protein